MDNRTFSYRSLFWPVLLIGVGCIWLASSLGLTPQGGWLALLRLWPILLIAAGVDILLGRRSALLGGLIGLITVAVAIALLFTAPPLGVTGRAEAVTDRISEPIGTASSAEISLRLSIGPSTISALSNSEDLLQAEITHIGELVFDVRGDRSKQVDLREREFDAGFGWFNFLSQERELAWFIQLSPELPMELTIHGGVGDAVLNLGDLMLARLQLEGGVGELQVDLPSSQAPYPVFVQGGVGEIDLTLEQGAQMNMTIEAGVGDISIEIPQGAAVRLEGETGVGEIRVPASFVKVSGDDSSFMGEQGVWETPGFEQADIQITITFQGGVGDLIVR